MDLPDRVSILVNRPEESNTLRGEESVRGVMESAHAAAEALRQAGCKVVVIGCGRTPADLLDALAKSAPQAVVNLAEEAWGSDRFEPAAAYLLLASGIPFTGCPPEALALARDKQRARLVASAAGVSVPEGEVFHQAPEQRLARPYAVIVKPACSDGSFGIGEESVVEPSGNIAAAVHACSQRCGWPVLVERYIDGRELNVTLVERDCDDWMIIPSEIDFSAVPPGHPRIVSYVAKWHPGSAEDRATAVRADVKLDPVLQEQVQQTAHAIIGAFELRGYARYDARVDIDGRLTVVDINPNPDMSPGAGVIRSVGKRGIDHAQFVCGQVRLAVKRGSRKVS